MYDDDRLNKELRHMQEEEYSGLYGSRLWMSEIFVNSMTQIAVQNEQSSGEQHCKSGTDPILWLIRSRPNWNNAIESVLV